MIRITSKSQQKNNKKSKELIKRRNSLNYSRKQAKLMPIVNLKSLNSQLIGSRKMPNKLEVSVLHLLL